MPDIVDFDPGSASREEWARYHAFRRIVQAEWRPDEPLAPDDVEELRLKHRDPLQRRHRYQVLVGDEMVAELEAEAPAPESPEYATNRHLLWTEGYVLKAHRRRGIGHGLAALALGVMDAHGETVLSSMADEEAGHAFLRGLGAQPKMTERHSRCDLRQVDWGMVARWVRDGESESRGARLDVFPDWVPDDQLDEYCAARNELLNTMPFEGLDHGDIVLTPGSLRLERERMRLIGAVNPTCVVRDADASIVGMTDTVKNRYEPAIVRQEFTGVHPRARGRGLGKWLKAAMLQHIRQAYPDTIWVSTENAGSNAPMLSINVALGFRPHRIVTVYQVERETLRSAVQAGIAARPSDLPEPDLAD